MYAHLRIHVREHFNSFSRKGEPNPKNTGVCVYIYIYIYIQCIRVCVNIYARGYLCNAFMHLLTQLTSSYPLMIVI